MKKRWMTGLLSALLMCATIFTFAPVSYAEDGTEELVEGAEPQELKGNGSQAEQPEGLTEELQKEPGEGESLQQAELQEESGDRESELQAVPEEETTEAGNTKGSVNIETEKLQGVELLSEEYSWEMLVLENKELLMTYADKLSATDEDEEAPLAEDDADFNETEKQIYDALCERIAEIAEGKDNFTEITISLSEAIRDIELTDDVYEALFADKADFRKILFVLMIDNSEELYWVDCSDDGGFIIGGVYVETRDKGTGEEAGDSVAELTVENALFKIKVNESYRPDGEESAYVIDPEIPAETITVYERVADALELAGINIVAGEDETAGEDTGDGEEGEEEPTAYTITYELNGGTNSENNPETYEETSEDILLEDPSRTGYLFAGWYTEETFQTKITKIPQGSSGDITVYAKWTPVTYNVKYNGNGATAGKMTNTTGRKYDTAFTLPANAFTRTGYSFAGWNTKADGTGTTYKNKASVKNLTAKNGATVTLYAKWTAVNYKITYQLNGGKNNAKNPATYTIASAKITLQNPTRTGYKFAGWYSDAKFTKQFTAIPKGSTGNKTVYAKWTMVTYKITYQLNGGKNNSKNPATYKVNTATITLQNPTRTGYKFAGWYSDAKFTTRVKTINKGSAGNKTLYAKWTPVNYTITYKLNGGKNNSKNPATYTIATANITLQNPTRTGYKFAGWYSDAKFTTRVKTINKGSTGNKTLYAKWALATYTITYNLNGGKNNSKNPASYQMTTNTITLQNPTRTGYTFGGWYSDASFTTRVKTIAKGSAGNKTLYAKWTADTYKISYQLYSGTNNSANPATYTIATPTITLASPVKNGYRFDGWYSDAGFQTRVKTINKGSTGNKTLYAKWVVNTDATEQIKSNDTTLNVLDFGAVPNDGADDTAAFNDAIYALGSSAYPNAQALYVPGGTFHINAAAGGIRIESKNNVTICMENNTVLQAIPTSSASYSILYISGSDHVTVIGGSLKGERGSHTGSGGENGMGILAYASTNLSFANMRISDCWGDGIFLGPGFANNNGAYSMKFCNTVSVTGCVINNNRRDNISIVGAHNVLIDSCNIYDANGTPNQCGILIEPYVFRNDALGVNSYQACKNITISNTSISSYKNIKATSRADRNHLAFATCLISSGVQKQINASDNPINYMAQNVTLQNCSINGDIANYSGKNVKINGCTIKGTVEYHASFKVTLSGSSYTQLKQF